VVEIRPPEHKKPRVKEELGFIKFEPKAKSKAEHGSVKFDQKPKPKAEHSLVTIQPKARTKAERGPLTVEPKAEASKALDVYKFDVVEPEFVARLQTAATKRSGTKPLHEILREFIQHARLALAVLSDRNGMVKAGASHPVSPPPQPVDFKKLAALAAAQMAMVQVLGKALDEEGQFTCIFQEGERYHLFIYQVEGDFILTALAEKTVALGLVRACANEAVAKLSRTLLPRSLSSK
jgi:predicted regulator of Ras-like GTPase activity (Roadblock/LC7/MglB family)